MGLAVSACTIAVPTEVPCVSSTDCPSGQLCSEDGHCRNNNACPGTELRCPDNGNSCTDLTTPSHCGGCDAKCLTGFVCQLDANSKRGCSFFCIASQQKCDSAVGPVCKDLANDRTNCGTCGHGCADGEICLPDAALTGRCVPSCLSGQKLCGSACVNETNDPANCGACGKTCGPLEKCQAMACVTTCVAPARECTPGSCTDIKVDSGNCGNCGNKCDPGLVCSNGACQISCQKGLNLCGTKCVDETSDPNNCGACGTACLTGFVCRPNGPNNSGRCELDCPGAQVACGNTCVDLTTDPNNCGACSTNGDHACGQGLTCQQGHCKPWCPLNQTLCNAGNTCVDTGNDPNNCGTCGKVCGYGQTCSGGVCGTTCPASQTNCNGACVNLKTDPANCGACGTAVPAGSVCLNGGPSVSCPQGSMNCNGICVDPTHDNAHCGNCSTSCAPGTTCQPAAGVGGATTGACKADCAVNFAACATGCRDTATDNANCGTCGHACASGFNCVSGTCSVACPSGLATCAQPGGTQACKDLQNDPTNCGQCGGIGGTKPCDPGQICQAGKCVLTCPSTLATCGPAASPFCTSTQYDPGNCGTCGTVCGPYVNATAACGAGNCKLVCSGSFADCDKNPANGCEANLASDPAHCGGCLNACKNADNAAGTCSASSCGLSCQPNFENCDADVSNGCEANLLSDAAHCSSCATSCGGATPYCNNGSCAAAAVGVQQNLSYAAVTAGGWTQCFTDSSAMRSLSAIQTACGNTNVMIACRVAGTDTLVVAAQGLRTDVFGSDTPHAGNGVSWYFGNGAATGSWGLAPAGASINRNPCDVAGGVQDGFAAGFGSQRICWLTSAGNLSTGARCGDHDTTGSGSTYERLIFTKP